MSGSPVPLCGASHSRWCRAALAGMAAQPCDGTLRAADWFHGRRYLPADEEPRAERSLASRYGFGRWLFEATMDLMRVDMCYLEITPGAWGG